MRNDVIAKVKTIALTTKCPKVRKQAIKFLEIHGDVVKIKDYRKSVKENTIGFFVS